MSSDQDYITDFLQQLLLESRKLSSDSMRLEFLSCLRNLCTVAQEQGSSSPLISKLVEATTIPNPENLEEQVEVAMSYLMAGMIFA